MHTETTQNSLPNKEETVLARSANTEKKQMNSKENNNQTNSQPIMECIIIPSESYEKWRRKRRTESDNGNGGFRGNNRNNGQRRDNNFRKMVRIAITVQETETVRIVMLETMGYRGSNQNREGGFREFQSES